MKNIIIAILLCNVVFSSCNKDPALSDATIDGGKFPDPSLSHPEKYLVSVAKPAPTQAESVKPVIIVVHGYGASTFEWDEFRSWANGRSDFYISQVLLGGHGIDYEHFKNATWESWKQPIINEYSKLEKEGYTNISLAGSSTGSTLLLEMIANGYFNNHVKPKHIFLIDPVIIPSNKTLSLISIAGPVIGYTTADNSSGEDKYYFHFRPHETLTQLNNVINIVRKELQVGITLPSDCTLKIFKSEKDGTADPVSAVLIYKGTKTSSGSNIEIQMVPSDLHVFTRLDFRDHAPSPGDFKNRDDAFADIANRIIR
ncbi:MAG: hypothetical protein ABI151_00185 [Chitinophagaceae bacterium]